MSFDPYLEWLGVAADCRPPSYYDLLGLDPFQSDEAVIERQAQARIGLVRRYQTGSQGPIAQVLLGELAEAYACLSDARRKEEYDRRLRGLETTAEIRVAGMAPRDVSGLEKGAAEVELAADQPSVPPEAFVPLPTSDVVLPGEDSPSASASALAANLAVLWHQYRAVTAVVLLAAACVAALPLLMVYFPFAEQKPERPLLAGREEETNKPMPARPETPPPGRTQVNETYDDATAKEREIVTVEEERPAGETLPESPTLGPEQRGSRPEPLGVLVASPTQLAPGMPVEVEWGQRWWNGRVLELLADGRVKVHYDGWASEWDEAVLLERLRVGGLPAPGASAMPASEPSSSTPAPGAALATTGAGNSQLPGGESSREPEGVAGSDPLPLTAPDSAELPLPPFAERASLAGYSPQQATGPPDTPAYGDSATAWATYNSDAPGEWLLLEFPHRVVPALLRVYENYAPGAVVQVTGFGDDGSEQTLWAGQDPAPREMAAQVSEIPLAGGFVTNRIRIRLDSEKVASWNEIDAVQLIDRAGRRQWAVAAAASSTYASELREPPEELFRRLAALEQRPLSRGAGDEPSEQDAAPGQEPNLEQLLERARVGGKYALLLGQWEQASARAQHGEFHDLGLQAVRRVPGSPALRNAYWVYAAPYWYAWRDLASSPIIKASWSAEQMIGPPDTPQAGDQATAWASATPDGQSEWLLLEYARPVTARQIRIYESFNPGAIGTVWAFGLDGKEEVVGKGSPARNEARPSRRRSPGAASKAQQANGIVVTTIDLEQPIKTNRIKIEVLSPRVPGYNEIDAVELVDEQGESHWATAAAASSSYGISQRSLAADAENSGLPRTYTELDQRLSVLETSLLREGAPLEAIYGPDPVGRGEATNAQTPVTADLWELRLRRLERVIDPGS